ncbi:RHS repeat-associated core domain-containing protein [Streptomyces sp. NBC_00984]|uniref:RHS repeat-associated core domain-containing protein n=1 Tax=Streptomyces sp. NBC_00984 TaxID=2903700 RepID=UPI00386AAA11|nr:RHS repeat-associated core domain-containing protein [Streptomyces sp. NBC_00984]
MAVRAGATTSYLIGDHQGTAMSAIAVGTLALTRRKQLPFGQLRTAQSTAFGTRGFVGGTNDPTGLTHLGAREYDPALGRFLSVDPVIDINDPAQMNAYSYAHNNPLTKSDPDGLRPDGPAGGASYNDDAWARDRGMNVGYTKKGSKWVWNRTPMKDKESQKRYAAYRANPSGYLINDSYAEQRKKEAAEYRAQAKARAEAEQRKRDGILGGILKGNYGAAWSMSQPAVKGVMGKFNKMQSRVTGAAHETVARLGGAECFQDHGPTVCQTALPMYGRGGTNVGGTYVTGWDSEYISTKRLKHERVHTKQWDQAGLIFIPKYFMAGLDPCHNRYEIAADLDNGGYPC